MLTQLKRNVFYTIISLNKNHRDKFKIIQQFFFQKQPPEIVALSKLSEITAKKYNKE